ncbi:MAG: glycerophosphoryl diester phosphodiesterase membrane domain-containing protein [Sphingomonadales bacterium]|nr:glycerophosphoryl diester phosphodiesterase membrane domain-containing protein [Sphingomonadales bacterium]
MKFDSNLAWKQASEAVTANRDVLFAIAGVFLLLPNLAFALLFPQPEPPAGIKGKEALEFLINYWQPALPWLLLAGVFQAVGTLAMLTLFTDRTRPTVGEALRQGVACLIPYFLSQILVGIGMGAVGAMVVGAAAATKSVGLIVLAVMLLLVGVVYVGIKTSLTSPVIAVEGERNPLAALKRSWELTRGNSLSIFLFYLLVGLAFGVVLIVAMLMIGALLAVMLGVGETARMIATAISSLLSMVFTTYFVAIVAAIHRQLAGPSGERVSATFD